MLTSNTKSILIPVFLILALLACNLPLDLVTPTDTPEPERTERPADTTEVVVSPTIAEATAQPLPALPTFTPESQDAPPASAVLPAALYLLSDQSGSDQVYRLEQDGMTLTQVTFEPAPVRDFSVSSVGRVAYISDNDLWLANADGSERTQMVDGPPQPSVEDNNRINLEMSAPRWGPDGGQERVAEPVREPLAGADEYTPGRQRPLHDGLCA